MANPFASAKLLKLGGTVADLTQPFDYEHSTDFKVWIPSFTRWPDLGNSVANSLLDDSDHSTANGAINQPYADKWKIKGLTQARQNLMHGEAFDPSDTVNVKLRLTPEQCAQAGLTAKELGKE